MNRDHLHGIHTRQSICEIYLLVFMLVKTNRLEMKNKKNKTPFVLLLVPNARRNNRALFSCLFAQNIASEREGKSSSFVFFFWLPKTQKRRAKNFGCRKFKGEDLMGAELLSYL